jgi:gas vesicle protein
LYFCPPFPVALNLLVKEREIVMTSNRFSCFLLGLGAGAAVMLLYAPKSGKDTRRYLSRRVDDGREFIERGAAKVGDLGGGIRDVSRQTFRRANKVVSGAIDAGRSACSAIL